MWRPTYNLLIQIRYSRSADVIIMSGNIGSIIQDLFNVNEHLSAAVVMDPKGKILHTEGQWEVDGPAILKDINDKKSSVTIQGIKYSTFQVDEIRLIASNRQGQGHCVCSIIGDTKSGYKGWVIAYVNPKGDLKVSYRDVFAAANKMRNLI